MKNNYSIDEILGAIDDLAKLDRKNIKKKEDQSKKDKSLDDIPKSTLKIIEEAEKQI